MRYLVRRNGVFHYRRQVPSDVQADVGKCWWKISLKTGSLREAEETARSQAVAHDKLIATIRGTNDRSRLMALETRLRGKRAENEGDPSRELTSLVWATFELEHNMREKQYAEAQSRLASLSTAERLLVEGHGGLEGFLSDATGEVNSTYVRDPIEKEVRLRRLEPKAALLRKLGIDRHRAVLATTNAHSKNPPVTDAVDAWLKDKKQGPSSAARHRVAINRFVELNGNITVQQITREMVRDYRAAIENLADQRCLPAKKRGGMTDGERDGVPLPRVSAKTVERHLISIKAFLTWCVEQEFVAANVATGVKPPKDTRPKASKRRAFERPELKTLLARVIEEEGTDCDKAWFVRLCAYTGIRLDEAAQLPRKNVRQLDGVWIVEIDDLDGRRVKTETSIKQVPLHPAIRDSFVEWVQKGDCDRVFSSFKPDSARFVNKLSGDFARLMDRAGLTDPRLVFHSLRHTLKREMTNARVDPDMRRQILGHAPRSAHDQYAGASVSALAEELAKVRPFFD